LTHLKFSARLFQAASSFQLTDEEQLAGVVAETDSHALTGNYQLFKTLAHFDTTAKHADWLGEDSQIAKLLASPNAG
jgi:hypothetical protein